MDGNTEKLAWEDSIRSSVSPNIIEDAVSTESSNVVTIVSVIIIVIVAIVALFVLALVIDHRHQKLSEQQQQCIIKKRRSLKLSIPRCKKNRGIVEDAEDVARSQPPLETITEVV